jgi:2-polyprenyl-3-methyl-5-hydroxy-6-metoxy-1,4-benzoquinol methylase
MTPSGYYETFWRSTPGSTWTPASGKITEDEQEFFFRYLQPGVSCLDYGCGNAKRYGASLAANGVDYRGFDISEHALREAEAAGLKVGQLSTEGKTTLPDEAVDTALCFEVFEHLMEPQQALAELQRCLKPGGHAIISVPNAAHYQQRLEFLLTGFWCPGGSPHTSRRSPWCDPHIRFFNPTMLRRLLREQGWEIVELRGERFSFCSLPVIWRKEHLHPLFEKLSLPFGWLGRVFPGLFSRRLFVVARKAAPQS